MHGLLLGIASIYIIMYLSVAWLYFFTINRNVRMWSNRMLFLAVIIVIIYVCNIDQTFKVLIFSIIELVGIALLLMNEFVITDRKDVQKYNETVFQECDSIKRLISDLEQKKQKEKGLSKHHTKMLDKGKERLNMINREYPRVEQNSFLLFIHNKCVAFLKLFFVKFRPLLQLNGWPPKKPGKYITNQPILSTGYILLFFAFAIQLWYAIELLYE